MKSQRSNLSMLICIAVYLIAFYSCNTKKDSVPKLNNCDKNYSVKLPCSNISIPSQVGLYIDSLFIDSFYTSKGINLVKYDIKSFEGKMIAELYFNSYLQKRISFDASINFDSAITLYFPNDPPSDIDSKYVYFYTPVNIDSIEFK